MNGFKKKLALLLVLAMCLTAFAACSGPETQEPEKAEDATTEQVAEEKTEEAASEAADTGGQKYFVFSSASPVIGLNPILNTTGPDNGLHNIIMESLVNDVADENDMAIAKPAGAESWEVSEDGKTYTFKLRENATWNDGVPVTAHDFVYTFQTMATPEVASTNAWLFDGVIVNFNEALYEGTVTPEEIGVKALDDYTLEFTLVKPFSYFLELLNGSKPIRQDKYEEWGTEYGTAPDKVVTNGPFVVESWDQNTQMTLVKNEMYWGKDDVKLDRIDRKIIGEAATAAQAFIGGDLDVLTTNDPDWKGMIMDSGNFNHMLTDGNNPEFLGFNAANEYFQHPKIRLAFSLAIDREKFVDELRDGEDEPLYSLFPHATNVGDKLYTELVGGKNEIIKDLMQEYPDPKALLIEGLTEAGLDPDPANMQVRYATRGTAEYSKKSAEWLLQQWQEKLGVTVTIDMMEWNIMWDKVDEGDYDIATSGWGPYYNDPNALLEIFQPESGYFNSHRSGWAGEDADTFAQLLEDASLEPDQQKRAEILLEAEKLLVGTGIIAPTYAPRSNTFLTKFVEGYHVNPHSQIDYTIIDTTGRP